jgi:hypothetical protein
MAVHHPAAGRHTPPTARLVLARIAITAGVVAAMAAYFAVPLSSAQLGWLLVALLLVLLVCTLRPNDVRDFVSRIQKISGGGLDIELQASNAQAAAQAARTQEPDDSPPAATITELRFKLERKLTYMAGNVLGPIVDGRMTSRFITIGSLAYDGYLTNEEALLADTILTTSDWEFRSLPYDQQIALLRDGGKFVANVRAAIFHGYVRRELERRYGAVQRDPATAAPRDSFIVHDGDQAVRYVTVFATKADSSLLRNQLARLPVQAGQTTRIVIPALDTSPQAQPPAVVAGGTTELLSLKDFLEAGSVTP